MADRKTRIGALVAMILAAAFAKAGAEKLVALRAQEVGGPPPEATGKGGLHLPQGRRVNFVYTMSDGGGYRWDIQHYGTVGSGTNYAYSGAMYCQISGVNVRGSPGGGWLSPAGDEVEIGPFSQGMIRVYRRIKVYKDQPLARWLDIFENPSPNPVTVQVQLYSCLNYGISRTTTTSGTGAFGDKDWAFITETQGGGNTPMLLHIVCDKRSKVRPAVQVQSNNIHVRWNLTIGPNQTAVLCHFEAQHQSQAVFEKFLQSFRAYRLLNDLSAGVRRLIVNFPGGSAIAELDLERSETADTVMLTNGDPIYGRITNASYRIETFYGPMELPAEKVIGMAPLPGQAGGVRVLMADGQVLSGRLASPLLAVELPGGGGTLEVPMERVGQCGYQVSKQRPLDITPEVPLAVLRTGDRIAFDPGATKLEFRTRHGVLALEGKDLLEVVLDNAGNAVHRVAFRNGSRLAGFLQPEKIELVLRLGPRLSVPRHLVTRMVFAAEEEPDATLTRAVLSNEDELYGTLTDETLSVQTDFGMIRVRPGIVRVLRFDPSYEGRVAIELWNGTVARGRLLQEELTFAISPGPTVKLSPAHLRHVESSQTLPPEEVRKRIEQLVAQLGAESYRDRQAASESLIRMGAGIAPLLRKHLETDDPEVRQRLEEVLERLGGAVGPAPPIPMEFLEEG